MNNPIPGQKVRAQISGFCGGPVSYATVTLTWVSDTGASWSGVREDTGTLIHGSTADTVNL